jgi:hypothetical protein
MRRDHGGATGKAEPTAFARDKAGSGTASSRRTATIAELERALAAKSVSLVHLVDVWHRIRTAGPSDDAAELARLAAELETGFKECQSVEEVKATSFYSDFRSGVLLTGTGQIFTYYDSQSLIVTAEAEKLLWDMEGYSQESEELLYDQRAERTALGRKLFELTLHLLYAVDQAAQSGDGNSRRVTQAVLFVNDEFAKARVFRDRVALRAAQTQYLKGTFDGVLALLVAVSLIGILLGVARAFDAIPSSVVQVVLGALVAGGVGAVVSVLQRITTGKLDLDVFAGRRLLRRLGMFRPIVGALFGIVTFVAVEGGVIPFEVPATPERRFYFYCALAFLAGFNERWAQDMLGKAGQERADGAGERGAPGKTLS